MYTIIVFWQTEQLNEEAQWVLRQENQKIRVLTLIQKGDQKPDVDKLRRELVFWVNAREKWRLFLIDNFAYQCVYYEKKDDKYQCCCCGVQCTSDRCGKGRNPFAVCRTVSDSEYKTHREMLQEIIGSILNDRNTKFVAPSDMFVIAVRDGEFQCRQEIRVPNIGFNTYWEIDSQLPASCRYLIFDVKYLGKEAYQREIFLFYCVISLLAHSKLCMNQFRARCVYRIRVTYSEEEYRLYLKKIYVNTTEQIKGLRKALLENGEAWEPQKEAMMPYPLITSEKMIPKERMNENLMDKEEWKKEYKEKKQYIYKIYNAKPEDYKNQWEFLRSQVSEEGGKGGAIYAEDKERYEREILTVQISKDVRIIPYTGDNHSVEEEIEAFELLCFQYEEHQEYNITRKQYFEGAVAMFVASLIIYIFIGLESFQWKIFGRNLGYLLPVMVILCTIFEYKYYFLKRKNAKIVGEMNRILDRVYNYQLNVEKNRNETMQIMRNTMLYWKREWNQQTHEESNRDKKLCFLSDKKKKEDLKRRLEMLMGIEGEGVNDGMGVFNSPSTRYITIGSEEIETEFTFIEEIRFFMKE